MDLNQSKCGILCIRGNVQPIKFPYSLHGETIKSVDHQKDLGVTITTDLKWSKHVLEVTSKVNKMLGFVQRSTFDTKDFLVHKTLYSSLVKSNLSYCSHVWAPQSVANLHSLECVQRCASRFILSLPFRTDNRDLMI